MLSSCPHCRKKLQFSESYQAKLQATLSTLPPGKRLTIKCTSCDKPIPLDSSTVLPAPPPPPPPPVPGGVQPPPPPDIEWLKDDRQREEERPEDSPAALLLYPNRPGRKKVVEALESMGYQIITADSVQQARERMNFMNFFSIIYHSQFESGELEESTFHQFVRQMPMRQRRYIFYILIGPTCNTLYDLEALAHSANLVINENDIEYIDVILRKSITNYEVMFAPIMEELKASGRG